MFDLTMDGRIARLTLNRPAARNAIPETTWHDLAARVAAAGAGRVLIVAGAGSAFCGGADLGDLAGLAGDAATIDAAEAARIGLVEQAVEHAGVAAEAMARAISAHAGGSLTGLKAMIARAGSHPGSHGDSASDALFDDSFASADFAEGIAAMRAGRRADFA